MFLKGIWKLHQLNILMVWSSALEDTAIFRSSACYPITKCWGEMTVVTGVYNSPMWPFCSFSLSVQLQESAHLVVLHHNKMVVYECASVSCPQTLKLKELDIDFELGLVDIYTSIYDPSPGTSNQTVVTDRALK